ncbi:MAG: type II secretion system protein N [Desulfocapsaceae bacterium]|jgi:type II secretory pathway component PulC|nr:type II secretion system protein N [Desulfocapsaceae bacterium]
MSSFTKTIIIPILLITLLCISLVEGFYYFGEKYLQTRDSSRKTVSAPVSAAGREQIIKDLKKPADYSVISRRNLFSSRKNGVEQRLPDDLVTSVEPSSMDVVLMGTVSGTGDSERAVIYDKKDKKQDLFQVGDYIQQAIIKQILRGKVILNLNGKDEMLDISEARNVSVPQVAKISPVVQTRKVIGRPVGQPQENVDGEIENTLPPGVQIENEQMNQPRQLRTYRGGVIVREQPVAPQ